MKYVFVDKNTGEKVEINRPLNEGQLYEIYRDGFVLIAMIKE